MAIPLRKKVINPVNYQDFLESKRVHSVPCGFSAGSFNPMLFDFQRDITSWALRLGRAAIFADCGLGKTAMQLEWARQVCEETGGAVLILAPLAVSLQTVREAEKFGMPPVTVCRKQSDVNETGVNITNYEMLQHFNSGCLQGIVLDESSILKSYSSKTRNAIIEAFSRTPYRLACTATPAPNNVMELGNHAEFLGVMSRVEMLSRFFIHDGGQTSKWRLKRHGAADFWKWAASWAVMVDKPSSLGYEQGGFDLPELRIEEIVTACDGPGGGMLWAEEARTLTQRRDARRESIDDRIKAAAEIVGSSWSGDQWIVWCGLNRESTEITKAIKGAVEVTGSDPISKKEQAMLGFAAGDIKVLVTKPKIAGFGMNWQNCHNVAYVGLSDSWEAWYQSIRRTWRFGQEHPVNVYVITSEREGAVVRNIKRKEAQALELAKGMRENMGNLNEEALKGGPVRTRMEYSTERKASDNWDMYLGDSVDVCALVDDELIDFSVFSPPFASLYTYSDNERDLGNCPDHVMFLDHFKYLVKDLFRITKPGRLCAFHCMALPLLKQVEGHIGLRDFPGKLISLFEDEGWIWHAEAVIWKDPVTAMQRTKALGLLWKQLKKDSTMSRMGIPDRLIAMRKPGINAEPVSHSADGFPVGRWQNWASPVWMDISPGDTLQFRAARGNDDERHICPLQLGVIERCIRLWSNPGDLVLSPFAGIGSEGYQAIKMGRRFLGIELKESYYRAALKNLAAARVQQGSLFDNVPPLTGLPEPYASGAPLPSGPGVAHSGGTVDGLADALGAEQV